MKTVLSGTGASLGLVAPFAAGDGVWDIAFYMMSGSAACFAIIGLIYFWESMNREASA